MDKRDEYTVEYTNMDSGMWMRIISSAANPVIEMQIGSMKEEETKREYADIFEPKVISCDELKKLPYSPKKCLLWQGGTKEKGAKIYKGMVDLIDIYLNQGENFISFPSLVDRVFETFSLKTPKHNRKTL